MCANLDIINDNVVEMNEESLTLTMSADDPSVTTITASSATIVIRENDNDGMQLYFSIGHSIIMTFFVFNISCW